MTKRYEATDWQNRVTDTDGTVIQPGTPLTAEKMNKLEQQVAEVSNERGEPNGTATLNENGIVHAWQLPNAIREMRVVNDIATRDALETFEGLRVLVTDAVADESVEIGWAEYVYDGADFVKVGEGESLDIAITWADIQGKPADLLNKYMKEEIDELLRGKSGTDHTHPEFASITQLVNKVQELQQANEQSLHGHNNKSTLDKLTYSGAKQSIDLVAIEEFETHTHSFNDLTDVPNFSASNNIHFDTRPPTNTDDVTKGFSLGQTWIYRDGYVLSYYVCLMNVEGYAYWKHLGTSNEVTHYYDDGVGDVTFERTLASGSGTATMSKSSNRIYFKVQGTGTGTNAAPQSATWVATTPIRLDGLKRIEFEITSSSASSTKAFVRLGVVSSRTSTSTLYESSNVTDTSEKSKFNVGVSGITGERYLAVSLQSSSSVSVIELSIYNIQAYHE